MGKDAADTESKECRLGRLGILLPILSLALLLSTPAVSKDISWTRHDITTGYHHDPNVAAVMDIDGDDDADLVVGSTFFGSGNLAWMENDGSQNFTEHTISTVGNYWKAVPIDFDKDGDADVFAFRGSEGPPYRLTLFLNDGSQNFTEQDIHNTTGDYPAQHPVDLDDDGDIDVVTTTAASAMVWLENTGGLTFVENAIESTLSRVYNDSVVDFDDDNDLDIVGVGIDNSIYLWANDGSESFTRHLLFTLPQPEPYTLGGLAVGDLDDDGDSDLVLNAELWPNFGRVSWLENQGPAGFVEHLVYESSVQTSSTTAYAVDLDHDGDPDILTGEYTSGGGPGSIDWYENDGSGVFTKHVILSPFAGSRPAFGDIDGNGTHDVIGCAFFQRDIVWWESDVLLNGMLLWNRLGSQLEIETSEVGPDGFIHGSGISYQPAMFDNGFTSGAATTGPNFGLWDAINPDWYLSGTVELWWKADRDFDATGGPDQIFVSGLWGDFLPHGVFMPVSLMYRWRGDQDLYQGFEASIAHHDNGTGHYLRTGRVVPFGAGDLVHVAFTWDVDGLPGHPEAWYGFYIDGVYYPVFDALVAGRSINVPMFHHPTHYFSMGYYEADFANQNQGVLDNVKIWDFARSDFTDRFVEGFDQDLDGISDPIDGQFTGTFVDEAAVFSDNFTDQHLGGTSFGFIVNRGGLALTVLDEPNPDGLRVQAAVGTGNARVKGCGNGKPIKLTVGDDIVITCSALTVRVVAGPVEIELGEDTVVIVPDGGIVTVTELGNEQVQVANDSAGVTVLVVVGGEVTELGPGASDTVCSELPTVTPPDPTTIECNSLGGVQRSDVQVQNWLASTAGSSACGAVTVSDDSPSLFPVGSTTVTFSVSDGFGEVVSAGSVLTIGDTTPPTLSVVLDPGSLWPPNHRMVDVTATVAATDACSVPGVLLTSVTSNESDNGEGDGNTVNDIQDVESGAADLEFRLRAERAGGGSGRIYTAVYSVTDGSGNTTSEAGFATVPHDQGGVVDPIQLQVASNADGTSVSWTPVAGVVSYDVIRGQLSDIAETAVMISLGPVACVEDNSPDADTVGWEDAAVPESGQAFFYLVQYNDGTSSSYGTESVGKPRAPGAGDCD